MIPLWLHPNTDLFRKMLCLHFACLILGLWQKIRTTILYDESLEDGETEDKSVGIFNSFPTSAVVATHFAAMPLPPSRLVLATTLGRRKNCCIAMSWCEDRVSVLGCSWRRRIPWVFGPWIVYDALAPRGRRRGEVWAAGGLRPSVVCESRRRVETGGRDSSWGGGHPTPHLPKPPHPPHPCNWAL